MIQQGQSVVMPVSPDHTDAVSILAARAVRAGLIRRALLVEEVGVIDESEKVPAGANRELFANRNLLERGVPPTSLQPPELAAFFRRFWPLVRKHTDTDRFRVESIMSVLWQVREVEGDVVECGSFRCGLGFLMAFAVKEWGLNKKVHLYDSFEGLPPLAEEDRAESHETLFYEGQFQQGVNLDRVREFLERSGLSDVVELHKGWFDQTLPLIPAERRFCFAHIDCDLYESTKTCWTHLLPRMGAGAGVVVDDYDSYGMYTATWEYLAETHYPLYIGALKQAHFFVNGEVSGEIGREDWSPLLANRLYCAYLASLCGGMIQACAGTSNGAPDDKFTATLDRILGSEHKLRFLERFIAFLYSQV